MIRQPNLKKGSRVPSYSGFTPTLRKAVEKESYIWDVYPSYIIASATAFALGVEEQPDYKTMAAAKRKSTLKKFRNGKNGKKVRK